MQDGVARKMWTVSHANQRRQLQCKKTVAGVHTMEHGFSEAMEIVWLEIERKNRKREPKNQTGDDGTTLDIAPNFGEIFGRIVAMAQKPARSAF